MDIWIGFAVAALKAGVSGAVGNEFGQALANQGIKIGSEKLSQYLEKVQKELSQVLSDKSLLEMKVPKDYIDYVREEIKELLRSISLDEDLFRNCRYDAKSLTEALYKKYEEQKKGFVEYKNEIQKVIYVMSEKAISLEKERGGFTADSLVHIMEIEDEQMELLRKIVHTLDESIKTEISDSENGGKPQRKKRLPDRTEEYCRKWEENMFLNDFDEDYENAGVNIPLHKLYQLPLYRLKDQKKDLSNLGERLDRCTKGQDPKNRMLLILGQPGMGKSTMITWFVQQYQEKQDADKKEILVYRFTDLKIDWSFGLHERKPEIGNTILEFLNMTKEDLGGKILILDGFDEVAVKGNRMTIINCLYREWACDLHIQDFSLLITCRENYMEDLSRLSFPYIILQPWNEVQIEKFCEEYGRLARLQISDESVNKMKDMREVFGIPLILYMTLALEIAIKRECSVVEVYDQIFSLDGGIYDRCLKNDASLRWDDKHWISELKRQIHQFSREISMWMFENNPDEAAIPKKEYEKIQDKIFEEDNEADKSKKKDVLIGNYFKIYDGAGTEQLTFVHRSIYQYFVVETIYSEGREAIIEMTEKSQEKLAGVLGYRLKEGLIDYTIGQYLMTKVSTLMATYSEEKKNQFYIWLEGTVGKMLDVGMLYYTGKNIKDYKNVIKKELNCFFNLLDVLRLFLNLSDRKYILQDVKQENGVTYIMYLTEFISTLNFRIIDLSKVYLKGANLSKADLKGADLRGANLIEADLRGADLRVANLKGANLSKADLRETDLKGANLSEADLKGADLRVADLREANLRGADLRVANLIVADLREANLSKADLKGADLRVAKLSKANLSEADLKRADLREANLSKANLSEADLKGAYL